jgi:hypothetical protein
MARDVWPKAVQVVLIAVATVTATGTGGHAHDMAPGNPAMCITVKLPELPQQSTT